jgi:4-oxalocrotonate tautomerase
MPILTVLIGGAPDPARDAAVAEALAGLTEDILGKDRTLTSVAIAHLPETQWFVGGATLAAHARTSFFLDVRVTQGTNTADEKARYVAAVFARARDLLGALHEASYVHVHEVPADAWGYGGRTQAARRLTAQPPSSNASAISS